MSYEIICPTCKKVIKEDICPHCGTVITKEMRRNHMIKGFTIIFIILIAIIYGLYSFFSDDKKEIEIHSKPKEEIALPSKPLEFSLLKYDVIKRATTGRHRLELTILPLNGQETATKKELISTVMYAAQEAYKKTSAPIIVVNMLAQNTGIPYADRQLAFITYIPDGKGFDGKNNTDIWVNANACEKGFTTDELTYLQLWGKLRTKYTDPKSGTVPPQNEEGLEKEIEQTMGKKLESDPMLNIMWEVDIK